MIRRYQYKVYLSELTKELKSLLKSKKRILLNAPTGGGKTYSILNLFKELSLEDKEHVYILATPNKSQSEQNKEYKVTAVVGGVTVYHLLDDEIRTVSSVYDKIDSVISEAICRKMKVTLIIDEAHELIYSYTIRRKAIHKIIDNLKYCETVVYMSATSNVLEQNKDIFEIDEVVYCKQSNRKSNANNMEIIQYKDVNVQSLLLTCIKRNLQNYKQIFVRHNDVAAISSICSSLNKLGITATFIDSSTKDDNDVYKEIIKNGTISNKYKVVLVTSIMDSGVSVKNDANVLCVYACRPNEFNVSSIEQFSNRFRNRYDKFILLKRKKISYNQKRLDIREKETISYFNDTKKMWLEKGYNLDDVVKIIKSNVSIVLDNPLGGFVSYVEIDSDTGEVRINEFLKALYVESLSFFTVANSPKQTVSALRNICSFAEIKEISELQEDAEFLTELKQSKIAIKEEKEEQYLLISNTIGDMLNHCKVSKESAKDKFAKILISWIESGTDIPKELMYISKELLDFQSYIEKNISKAILVDYINIINEMWEYNNTQQFKILEACTKITKKADLTAITNQLKHINFNINYNKADNAYISKYAQEFYDLFLIRKRLDNLIQKAKVSKALLSELQKELQVLDESGNIIKNYSTRKINNKINLLYNVSQSNNKLSSIRLKF